MSQVAIVTDSTADLPSAVQAAAGITVVPLNVHFGDETLRDQIDITTDRFMERLRESSLLPKTSQPSPARFEEAFRRLADEGASGIVCVTISAKLSGTFQSATLAAETVRDSLPVEVVDSKTGSMALGLQAMRAAELARQGIDAAAIAAKLRAETGTNHVVFVVDTLEFLQRNGRIGRAAALIGGILQLKPLLRVDEGQVVPYERTRTKAKAITGLVDFVRGLPRVDRLSVLYSTDLPDGEALADRLADATGLDRERIILAQLGPVIGAHIGPGALGVAVFEGEAA